VADLLGERAAGVFDRAVMHVPIETAREARELARQLGADCAVAIGGGSTTGLGKAIALDSGLPILAIPTTYAGSEMTPIYGITEAGLKKTGKDPRVLPRTVIYDPELTLTLPVDLSVTSGMNAIAHAAEGLYAQDSNPIMDLMAEQGIAAIARALPGIRANPSDLAARSDALYGAWLCGSVLGNVGMALHHKLCHTLGGSFNLPHAEVHTVVLPHAMAFNAPAVPEAMQRIARAVQGASAAQGLFDLARDNGAPVALRDIGMKAEDLDRAADIAVANPYWNPRPIGAAQRSEIRELLQRAFDGVRPN
jgi:maleylacetate reductase